MTVHDIARTTGSDLRSVMRHWPTGITVITATDVGGAPVGLVCNSFTSVSLAPPLVSWAVDFSSSAIDAWRRVDAYSVHILAERDAHHVERFTRRGAEKFSDVELMTSDLGTPVLADVEVRLDCTVAAQHEAGDHLILIGEVVAHESVDRFEPLTTLALTRRSA